MSPVGIQYESIINPLLIHSEYIMKFRFRFRCWFQFRFCLKFRFHFKFRFRFRFRFRLRFRFWCRFRSRFRFLFQLDLAGRIGSVRSRRTNWQREISRDKLVPLECRRTNWHRQNVAGRIGTARSRGTNWQCEKSNGTPAGHEGIHKQISQSSLRNRKQETAQSLTTESGRTRRLPQCMRKPKAHQNPKAEPAVRELLS